MAGSRVPCMRSWLGLPGGSTSTLNVGDSNWRGVWFVVWAQLNVCTDRKANGVIWLQGLTMKSNQARTAKWALRHTCGQHIAGLREGR